MDIHEHKEHAYRYTIKGNAVAIVTDGTAVLGLGDIGPEAAMPVMEGKAILFKRFADIDVFDLEIDTQDPEEFVRAVHDVGGLAVYDQANANGILGITRAREATISCPYFCRNSLVSTRLYTRLTGCSSAYKVRSR